mmetsp:Transcript_25294/g.31115  ORF Transcript_25294/g.31115 Transcript_25294/m.31115 type:complete len:186 (+) Transcript_25294:97-654(+)
MPFISNLTNPSFANFCSQHLTLFILDFSLNTKHLYATNIQLRYWKDICGNYSKKWNSLNFQRPIKPSCPLWPVLITKLNQCCYSKARVSMLSGLVPQPNMFQSVSCIRAIYQHLCLTCALMMIQLYALIDFLQNFVSQKFRLLPRLNHITNVTVFTYISHFLSSILASYKRLQKNNPWRKGVVTT